MPPRHWNAPEPIYHLQSAPRQLQNCAGNLLNSRALKHPPAPMNLDNIRIVLVNTTHPGNIGGVARAMKNMGLSRLVLVAPVKYPDEQARWRAASPSGR